MQRLPSGGKSCGPQPPRDAKFTLSFRGIIESAGVEILRLPPKSPNLNSFAERFVKSIKDECLDHLILFGEASLQRAIENYLEHYLHAVERPPTPPSRTVRPHNNMTERVDISVFDSQA